MHSNEMFLIVFHVSFLKRNFGGLILKCKVSSFNSKVTLKAEKKEKRDLI